MRKNKKIISSLIVIIMSLNILYGMKVPVMAETFRGTCGENLTWELDNSTGTLIISGSGTMDNFGDPNWSEDVAGWIQTRKTIKKIIISEGVTSIGDYAFKLRRSVDEIILPKSLKRIGIEAFYDNRSLEYLDLPNSVSIIDDKAFYKCSGLKKIEIPSSVKKIGDGCFSETGLENVTLNEGLKEIGYGAFHGVGIKRIVIPDSVETFDGHVFCGCESLEYIKLGKNLSKMSADNSLAYENFQNCPVLKTIGPDETYNIHYTWQDEIPNNAFCQMTNLEKVYIANGIRNIGQYAFFNCVELKNVKFSTGLKTIGKSTFRGCKSLNDIELPSTLESIGEYAFISSGESRVIIPKSVSKIGDAAIGYNATLEGMDSHLVPVKKENYVIKGYSKSVAETYAKDNKIKFEKIEDTDTKKTDTNISSKIKQTINAKNRIVSKSSKALKINASTNGDGKLTYSSSNKKVVTVNSEGKVSVKRYGKATIVIKAFATSKYTVAVKKITITVVPKKVTIKKVSSTGRKRLSVLWKNDKTITGYQIHFSTRKDFNRETYERMFKKSVTKMSIVGLKSKKKYYVRIRSYVNVGGKKYYSAWCKVKNVKIK